MPSSDERKVEPRFLTIDQVATYLSVSISQLDALVRTGEVPAVRIEAPGKREIWRVDRQLEKYLG